MNKFALALLLSMTVTFHSPILPTPQIACFVFVLCLAALRKRHWFLTGLCFGVVYVSLHGHTLLAKIPESHQFATDIRISGRVVGIPKGDLAYSRFYFQTDAAPLSDGSWLPASRLRLSWYRADQLPKSGERWSFTVRLKPRYGLMNPGGFDYEKWLLSKGVSAVGYVRKAPPPVLLEPASPWQLGYWRQRLSDVIDASDLSPLAAAMTRALVIGDGSALASEDWDAFRQTGTSHLLVISGLHITLVAGVFWWLAARAWYVVASVTQPPVNREPIAAAVSVLAALLYAGLAGFTIPTTRALLMLLVYVAYRLGKRHMRRTQPLAVVLVLVLLLQPLSPLLAGFWLSFYAVGFIYFLLSVSITESKGMVSLLRWHVALSIGLAPLTVWFFAYYSPLSMLANLLAVPLVSALLVPMKLIGTGLLLISADLGQLVLEIAAKLTQLLLAYLHALSAIPLSQWWWGGSAWWRFPFLFAAVFILLLPRGTGLNGLSVALFLSFIGGEQAQLPEAHFRVDVLDVGQGLSVLVRTRNHSLLFDTGGKLGGNLTMAKVAVLPYLRYARLAQLDRLVVSHPDSDHAAGISDLQSALTVQETTTHEKFLAELGADSTCVFGQHWVWDGVTFTFLNPAMTDLPGKNNNSCVLLIQSGKSSVLLPGDIEVEAESALLDTLPTLQLDVLVAPHHGSKTSSSHAFLQLLNPEYVVYSAGYRNRFGFPHPEVANRYRAIGATAYRTDRDGMISFRFSPQGLVAQPEVYRNLHREFWRSDFDLELQ